MRDIIKSYVQLERHVLQMIKAEFFIQLVGAAFFLILNIYLAKEGFSDPEIANFISYRFLAVMVLAFPLGFYIKGKRLKPFFMIGSLGVPFVAIVMILAIRNQMYFLMPFMFIFWGVVFTCFQVSTLPYIMRNTSKENQSHAISLNYATHSFGTISCSLIIFALSRIIHAIDEGTILLFISFIGIAGVFFLIQLKTDEVEAENQGFRWKSYNWGLLIKAIVPTVIISIGAGLTIPFINLFFYHDFGVDSSEFALIGGGASLLVAFMALLVPKVKVKLGFKKGITFTQSIAVLALVALATTEFYVGKENQEILSAVTAAIWSGSWYFSSQIFRFLKNMDMPYAFIFYITAGLYAFGVLTYYLLILDYERREE